MENNGAKTTERFDYLLAATGRRANVDGLILENTSLELDERGVPKFDRYTMQCGDGHVFLAGDVNGDIPLLHQGSRPGPHRRGERRPFPRRARRAAAHAVEHRFYQPNVQRGRSFRALQASGTDFAIGSVDFGDQGRSRVILKNRGLLRSMPSAEPVSCSGQEMVGPRMEHVAHLLARAHQKRMTVSEMLDMPFYHPVIEEGVRTGTA